MADHLSRLSAQLHAVYDKAGLSDRSQRRKAVIRFAARYGFVFFGSDTLNIPRHQVLGGVTSAIDQVDTNVCIGMHDGYDIVFWQRIASVTHDGYPGATHQWHIMTFDLHSHSDLPFVFIGTRQQSKTFYARLFTTKREVRQLDPSFFSAAKHFGAHYTVIASPAQHVLLSRLLTMPVTTTMASHHHPFAIEIQGDTLSVITETRQTNEAELTKMMHYGLWLARHLDENVAI